LPLFRSASQRAKRVRLAWPSRTEVNVCKRKSCPGALTEGTRHRGGKGTVLEHQGHRNEVSEGPVRGCLVEAVGALPFRAKAKRREASVAGKSARSDETRYPLVSQAYGRRDGGEILLVLPSEICRAPRER